jgi:hypothetical protein
MAALVFDHVEKGVHSFGSSDTTTTITLATTVDPTKTIVLIDIAANNIRTAQNMAVRALLSVDGTQLTLARGNGTTPTVAADVAWYVVEFSAGLTVQHITGTAINSNQSIPSAVTTSRSAIILSYQKSTSSQAQYVCASARFVDGSNFIVAQGGTSGTTSYVAQIIQFDSDSGVTVQYVAAAFTSGNDTYSTAITPVNPQTTLIIGSADSTSTGDRENAVMTSSYITDGANFYATRGNTTATQTGRFFIIDFGFGAVRRAVVPSTVGAGTTRTVLFADIDTPSQAIAIRSGGPFTMGATMNGSNNSSFLMYAGTVTDANSAAFTRIGTGQPAGDLSWQVMDFTGGDPVAPPWPGNFRDGVDAMSENSLRAPQFIWGGPGNNLNSVLTPSELRPTAGNPISHFYAWPSMALDATRGKIMFHGAGHANYGGNEIYAINLETLLYERINLPSKVTESPTNYFGSIGGANDAPAAAHQYSNTCILEINDTFYVPGGASYNTGAGYVNTSGNSTGPYLWDLTKNDPTKVGGADNTDFTETALGLYGWTNLQIEVNTNVRKFGAIEGTNNSAVEGGLDVIYTTERVTSGNGFRVYRTVVDGDATDPASWESTLLYQNNDFRCQPQTAFAANFAGINERVIIAWTGASNNTDAIVAYNVDRSAAIFITPTGLTVTTAMTRDFSLVYDPVRHRVLGTNGTTWLEITFPAAWANTGWVISDITPTQDADYVGYNNSGTTVNIWGKFLYWREHDTFIVNTMTNASTPTMWLYKPEDWSPLGGDETSATLTAQEEGDDTASGSAELIISTALTAQETGDDVYDGTASITEPDVIVAILDAQEEGDDTASFSADLTISGTLAAQEVGSDTYISVEPSTLVVSITKEGKLKAAEFIEGDDPGISISGTGQVTAYEFIEDNNGMVRFGELVIYADEFIEEDL